MMKNVLFACCVVVLASACDDDGGAPPGNDLVADMTVVLDGGNVDLAGGGADDGGVVDETPDLAGIPSAGDLGAAGASCTTACDCAPGLACYNMKCVAGIQAVYCCDQTSASCPQGALCQRSTGSYGTCGGGGAAVDLGGQDYCRSIPCTAGGVARCMQLGCTMCVAGSQGMQKVCAK
jgi:hypothetical protein